MTGFLSALAALLVVFLPLWLVFGLILNAAQLAAAFALALTIIRYWMLADKGRFP